MPLFFSISSASLHLSDLTTELRIIHHLTYNFQIHFHLFFFYTTKDLDYFLENTSYVLNEYGLMLSGTPLDKQSIDKLLTAIQVGIEIIKKEN